VTRERIFLRCCGILLMPETFRLLKVSAVLNAQITWGLQIGVEGTGRRKHLVHNGEFAPLFWFIAPTSRNHTPNAVPQPLVRTCVCWAGWSLTRFDTGYQVVLITVIIWRHPGEDLIGMGAIVSNGRMVHNRGIYLERSHRKRVNITVF
jgi:hypothetical protein